MRSFVLTSETAQIALRILRRLAPFPNPQAGGFIFTGDSGVGKTHLLRYLASLLETPNDPAWESLLTQLQSESRPRVPLNFLSVPIPLDGSIDLGHYLVAELSYGPHSSLSPDSPSQPELTEAEFTRLALDAASKHAGHSLGMLVLDEISPRLERLPDHDRAQREATLVKIVMDAFSSKGVLVILVMAERHLTQDRETRGGTPALQSLSNFCDFIWLSRNNIVEIISTDVATKNDNQRAEIRDILNRLRQKLPFLGPKAESFIDLYPVHPPVFTALFHLRLIQPSFSPLGFVQAALQAHSTRPAERPITLDVLFDHLQSELRTREEHLPLLESYDEFDTKVIPLLNNNAQAKSRQLLKGIAFLTICESQAPSVKALANALLLFDESDFLAGYSLASTLLIDLERKGTRYLVVEGEGLDRRYRLLPLESETGFSSAGEVLEQKTEFALTVPRLVHNWLLGEIPDWKEHRTSRSESSYQYLTAPLPARDAGPRGMVHFKSVVDPLWSLPDLEALDKSEFSWIVLILSPFERFYEIDQFLHELVAKSERLLIWRPEAPTRKEIARLRSLITQGLLTAGDTRARTKARRELHEILAALYIERGLFTTHKDKWCVGDAIGNKNLDEYLSLQLSELAQSTAGERRVKQGAQPVADEERKALRWGALLCGDPENEKPEAAESQVKAWRTRIEPVGIRRKLNQLPETFLSLQFWDSVKPIQAHLQMIDSILTRLIQGDVNFTEAMLEMADVFKQDESHLLQWKESLYNLTDLLGWIPRFEQTRDYLCATVVIDQKQLEQSRNDLWMRAQGSEEFQSRELRAAFDQKFLDFKNAYIDYYYSRHEEALHIVGGSAGAGEAVDEGGLRNLELLSKLLYTDKSFLNRAYVVNTWVDSYQCALPVREILERYPRCYCNFNPIRSARIVQSVAQVNAVIQDGLNYFRTILRRCSKFIIPDLKTNRVDDFYSKQIAALLSQGPMITLKPQCVEILNRIIEKHSADFLAETRAFTRPGPTFTGRGQA
jgi:hypothetical protein